MTAAATTGPASGPRPASSIPATSGIPLAHSSFSNRRLQGIPDAYLSPNDAGCKTFFAFRYATASDHFGAPSPKSLGLRCFQNGPPARREEGAYLAIRNRRATETSAHFQRNPPG